MNVQSADAHAARRPREHPARGAGAASLHRLELPSFSRLALLAHEGALDPRRWPDFLEAVARCLNGNAAAILVRSPASGEPGQLYSWGGTPDIEAACARRYFALDPFVQLPEGKVVTLHELVPREQLETSELYRDFLEPLDTVYNLGVDIREEHRLHVRLRISRSARVGDFSNAERCFCQLVVDHLRAAVRTHTELDLMRAERAAYADAMDHLTLAAFFLDESGRVLHTNAIAQRILTAHDGLSLQNGSLVLWHPDDAQRFRAAVSRALEMRRTGQPGLVGVIRAQRPSGQRDLGVIVRPIPARPGDPHGSLTAAVAVFVNADSIERDAPVASVQKLFGLTQKEARLALLLANGRTLQEAANELDISLNTARAHLRAIFAKTGIDRQTRLVRAILTSVASLG